MAEHHSLMETDVLVVGAGVAGLSLATALGREGFAVTVLDGASRPSAPPGGVDLSDWDFRVSALTPASIAFLQALGVWQQIPSDRVAPYDAMRVWDADGNGHIAFDARDVVAPCLGQIVENRQVVYALLKSVEALPRVQLCWDEPLESLSRAASGWQAVSSGGRCWGASLCVGADGARSRVRQLVDLPTREWSYGQSAIVGTVALSSSHQNTCWQAFLRTGPLALLPLSDPAKVAIVWSLDEEEHGQVAALQDPDFLRQLNSALAPSAPVAVAIGPRASFPLKQCHAMDYVREGVALVADAAHSIHPLAGQGINLGLADVAVLKEELLAARRGGLLLSSSISLKRYQRRRKTENLAMMAAMEGFKRGFGNRHPVALVARNLGLNFVDQQGWLKRWFMRHALA
jgi:2-polyprenylphenol 6-hydroxylase